MFWIWLFRKLQTNTHTLWNSLRQIKKCFCVRCPQCYFFVFISKYSNQNSQCQHHRCSSFNDPNYFSFEVSHFTLFIFIFLQLWILCFVIEIKESFNSKDYYHRHNLRPNDNHCFQLCNSLKIESTNYFTVTLILSLFGFCLADVSIYFTIFKAKCN